LCYQPANISAHRVQQRTEAAKANEAESHYFVIDPKERETPSRGLGETRGRWRPRSYKGTEVSAFLRAMGRLLI
jgi:hypothetical protein